MCVCAVRVPTLECFVAMPAREVVRRGRIKADIVSCQDSLNANILDAFKHTCSSVEYKQLQESFGIFKQADFSKKKRGSAPDLYALKQMYHLIVASLKQI